MIEQYSIENHKKFNDVELLFSPRLNIIIGDNGVGKVDLIYEIYKTLEGKVAVLPTVKYSGVMLEYKPNQISEKLAEILESLETKLKAYPAQQIFSDPYRKPFEWFIPSNGSGYLGIVPNLIRGGLIVENGVFIWVCPENGIGSNLLKRVAQVLLDLSKAGVQIIISTYSLFLIKEMEIFVEKFGNIGLRYFNMTKTLGDKTAIQQVDDFTHLDGEIMMLDEEFLQTDRFLGARADI